ncbi:MAG: SDR family oxidoreductase [Candidatus Latescibacteria bacterium]|jgi:NAD(P)-dependent dehydrogenase (short-subunit alcohol dehydrogenase family)|nr:SDR family oxidoreductase [Candidatus Latescibacterota bacterium]
MGVLDSFSLAGKTAVVTGGAGPLFGSSISEALAEAGATVITASRSRDRNEEYARNMCDRGFEVVGLTLDIADSESISSFRDQIVRDFGQIHILVNNAVTGRGGDFNDQTPEYWSQSAQGNMVGLFAMCKAFLPSLSSHPTSSILNISSIYGVVGNDPSLYEGTDMKQPPDYNFVKAGMINFTRYLANYYGSDGVRANCICPGGYFNDQPEPFVRNYEKRVPLGRMLNSEDIKGAAVFLASDASEYVTGTTMMVDGGFTTI